MTVINKFKKFFGNYNYKRRSARISRNKKTVNLDEAQKIGLLYKVPAENDYKKIIGFIKKLQGRGKTVFALGYVKNKDVPYFFTSSNSYSFFTLKDLNWYYKPGGSFVNNFLSEKFDIVINLSLQDDFPLQYICGLSNCSLRVGKFGTDNSRFYDLMIETDKIPELEYFIEQINHYLSIIKNKSYA